jgi:beta-galactosidase
VADDSAIRADGADMTRVVVKALDSNNQVVPTNNTAVTFTVTGPGAVVGESPLVLEAGTRAVRVRAGPPTHCLGRHLLRHPADEA